MNGERTELRARDQWDADDRDQIVRQLRRLGEERSGIFPFGTNGPQVFEAQGIYTLNWIDAPGSPMVELDFVGTDRHGETSGEIAVYWSDPVDPLAVIRTRFNLLSLTSRDTLAKALAKRTEALKLNWQLMLDQVARWTMEQYRNGDPGLLLRDAEELLPDSDTLTDPPFLESDGLTILFGDGGTGKSWIGLALAASLQQGESLITGVEVVAPRRVGYIDWEWSARRHRRRLAQLCGPDMPDIAYVRCSRPIHEERDRLRRWVRRFGIEYAIVDSIGLACGGEPESAEVANRFGNTLAGLVPAALGIGHVNLAVSRGDRAPDKPFGSVYWHDTARRTWYARSVNEPGTSGMTVGLYNKKANDGDKTTTPIGLRFTWAEERVAITRRDVREVSELDAERPVAARVRELLGRRGQLMVFEIMQELGATKDSVHKALQRGPFVKLPGPDGRYRFALKQKEG